MKKRILNFIVLLLLSSSLPAETVTPPALVVPCTCAPNQNTLPAGQKMTKGQRLTSTNGDFFLNYQQDNNLVLYRTGNPATSLWSTRTHGIQSSRVLLQQNGNLVILGPPSSPGNPYIWQSYSGSPQNQNCKLVVQDNGNMEIICNNKVVWETGTGTDPDPDPAGTFSMKKGDRLYSDNRNVFLNYQHDNNLVLYQVGSPAIPLWNTQTNGKATRSVLLQQHGNLVIIGPTPVPGNPYVWQSDSGNPNNRNCKLVVRNNGNMEIICSGQRVWQTNTRVK